MGSGRQGANAEPGSRDGRGGMHGVVVASAGASYGEGEGAGSAGTACLPWTAQGLAQQGAKGEGPPKEGINDEAQEQLSAVILQGLVFHGNASILIAKQ